MQPSPSVLLLAILFGPPADGIAAQQPPGRVLLAGLRHEVEIRRDRWGVNHIYATNEHDLFFAQGYAAASDRLFQFELWRRRATGTVAELLGPRELHRDIGARLHRYRGDLDAELNHYHPRGKAIVEAFVAGVNARVDEVRANPGLLPLEFRMLGIEPGRWTPAEVISRHQALTANAAAEVSYLRALRAIGAEALRDLLHLYGGNPELVLDPAIDPGRFPENVLGLYDAFRSSITFRPEDILPPYRRDTPGEASGDDAWELADLLLDAHDVGSNNWVLSGWRTQDGFPIMANDPHRVIEVPSLRYWVHLVAPGWNVIGGGEPVLPGVSIGHNGVGAWGLTIFGSDTEDIYVYETNPANSGEYRYQGRWEAMRVVLDTIPVRGQAPEIVALKYTRHGPVLYEDRTNRKAYALRAAWLEPGGAPYLASLRMNQAQSWDEFREAVARNHMPAENMVWADRNGTIGWQAGAITPRRLNWRGLLPVPGDGRYEWDGFQPITDLPHAVNPARGFIATANNYLFPPDYPFPEAQHHTGADPYRAARIDEVLGSGIRFSVAETARLQNDDLSLPARALVPLLRHLPLANPASAAARDRLLGWDFVLDQASVPAGIFQMFSRRLFANVRAALIPEAAREAVPGSLVQVRTIIARLYAPDVRFGADPVAGRDALLARSLDEAVAELARRFGPEMSHWQYGQPGFHHALIRHPLSALVHDSLRARLDFGPVPRGGDALTVTATGSADRQTSGGSFKIIVDTGNWDNALGINTPGQGGDPEDPHYGSLFSLWAAGGYFPLAYSRARVEAVTERVTVLVPGLRGEVRREK
jgi:penicillin amidase